MPASKAKFAIGRLSNTILKSGFLVVLSSIFALLVIDAVAVSQTSPASPTPSPAPTMPSDPVELMKLARKTNGIAGGDAQSWHLKATYQVFASDGKKSEEGVYEVLFADSRKYKQSFASKSFSQIDYTTDKGLFRTGDMQWASGPERLIVKKLFHPLPNDDFLQKETPQAYDRNMGGANLHCVAFRSTMSETPNSGATTPTFCFDHDKPILRYTSGWGATYSELSGDTLMNEIVVFHKRFVARDVSVTMFDKLYVKIHVDTLEELAVVNDTDFHPPATAAVAPPPRPMVPYSIMSGRIIKRVEPGYAALANPSGWEGRVIVDVIVGSDGHVKTVRPLSGSSMYQGMVANAVYKWSYTPFTVGNVPTEVETEVAYTFKPRT
jgi:hypothetical protein